MERIEYNERFLAQLKEHEGLRLEAYLDTEGHLTIGYGHNCEAWPVEGVEKEGDVISRVRAEDLLVEDVVGIAEDVDVRLPWWRGLAEPRQAVILNMAYNMGVPRLLTFKRMLAAVFDENWHRAGVEMLDSKWATQVKGRAAELARQMVLGDWE